MPIIPENLNMNGRVYGTYRKLLLLTRHVRYSRLLLGQRQPEVVREKLGAVYMATNRLLRDLKVDYWLVYGTLLGYHRDGHVIIGDKDVDFGVPEQYYNTIWQARHHLPDGFKMHDSSYRHHGPKLYVDSDLAWKADIYFYKESDGMLQSYEKSPYLNDTTPFPRSYVYPLQSGTFIGEETSIPNDTLAYLTHMYKYLGHDGVRDNKTGYWYPQAS